MQVLHGHWLHPQPSDQKSAFLFWSEDANQPFKQSSERRAKIPPHPFCGQSAALSAALQSLCGDQLDATSIEAASATLLLPSAKQSPQPSPLLVHDWDLGQPKTPALSPWQVTGLRAPLATALAIWQRFPLPDDLPPSIRLGDDLRFWMLAASLALEALSQHKVIPVLAYNATQKKSPAYARWRPVLDGPKDGPRLARLAEAMPPLCRAGVTNPEQAPAPRKLLDEFLSVLTDQLMRRWAQKKKPLLTYTQNDAVHQWLRALFEEDAQISGASSAQLDRLVTSQRAWLRNLYAAGNQQVRVAFRLEPPAQQMQASKNDWLLHFLLQARDDPSLLAPADQVWRTRGGVLKALNRQFDQPQETLLTGLGYAARLFAPLRASLQSSRPDSAHLSTSEAYDFLRNSAPLLEESGFGVLVPPWWNRPGGRLGVRLRMKSSGSGGGDGVASGIVSLENLVNYQWELSLGGATLTREEFDALVALKAPLVQVRGQWVQLDADQIESAIRFWERHATEDATSLQDAVHLGLGGDTVDGLPVEEVEFEGWLQEWMARFTGQEKLTPQPQPAQLKAQLRPYQQYGYSWLDFLRRWGMGACLADDMGLGKTIQTLAMLLRIKEEQGALPGPVLLIAPTSVVTNWAKEVDRFAPDLNFLVHQGGNRLRNGAFTEQAQRADLVLTSYPLVRRDAETLRQTSWFGVALDEAQNIKNPDTKQARTIRQLDAQFRLALTGTPVENRLSELWSIMHFLNPGYLGSQHGFRKRFALPIEREGDDAATQQLRRLVSPFILRRVKTDPTVIQDLPEKQESKVYCLLSEEQATLYEAVVQEALMQIAASDGIERKGMVLAMLTKLKQVCNHPAQFMHQVGESYSPNGDDKRSGKLARLNELLEEILAVDERTLIFTQFAEMGRLLKSYLQQRLGVATQFLHGGTPTRQRTAMIERFQEDAAGPPIFILSLKAGGTGLNLTRANHVFHFDRWWNPAVEDQATDRAFRIGQTRNVQVHKFVCTGTLEEKIDEMIERKKALAQSVVGGGESWLTELSSAELRDLVTLRRSAVDDEGR